MDAILNSATACLRAFTALVETATLDSAAEHRNLLSPDQIDHEFGRFKIWCGNLGALRTGHSSLDFRLRESTVIRTNVLRQLTLLQRSLTSSDDILSGKRPPLEKQSVEDYSSGESSEDDSADEEPLLELVLHLADTRDILADLYKLSFRMRNQATRLVSPKPSLFQDIDKDTGQDRLKLYEEFDRRRVVEFLIQMRKDAATATGQPIEPLVSNRDEFLINRLLAAISKRRRTLKYWRRHSEKLSQVPNESKASSSIVTLGLQPRAAQDGSRRKLEYRIEKSEQDSEKHIGTERSLAERTMLSETEATRLDPCLDHLIDSQSVVSYASTTLDIHGNTIDVPPPPSAASRGQEFVCPYCSVVCPAKHGQGKAWRAHILRDIQPYFCTYEDCPDSQRHKLYPRVSDWAEHERLSHRRVWQCFEHVQAIYKSKSGLHDHLKSSHRDAMTDTQMQSLLESTESSIIDDRTRCPFCLMQAPFPTSPEKHLASHMESIATISIPAGFSSMDDDEKDGGQSGKAQGIGSSDRISLSSFSFHTSYLDGSVSKRPSDEDQSFFMPSLTASEKLHHGGYADVELEFDPAPVELQAILQELRSYDFSTTALQHWSALLWEAQYNGPTLLLWASANGLEELVATLLASGAAPDQKDNVDRTPLLRAAKNGHEKIVRMLLDTNKVNAESQDRSGRTALTVAAICGHTAIVEILLEAKANVLSTDILGWTPILHSAAGGHYEIFKLLLRAGHVMAGSDRGVLERSLAVAASRGHSDIVAMLLKRSDVNINKTDDLGLTPLSEATSGGHTHIVKMLLDTGRAIPDQPIAERSMPLLSAAEKGCEDIVKLLLETGEVDINAMEFFGWTALGLAAWNGHANVAKLLLQTGNVDVNPKVNDVQVAGQTPLALAAVKGHLDVVKLLLAEIEVDVNSTDRQHRTPLMLAIQKGESGVAELLIGRVDVNVNKSDRHGNTPLAIAARDGDERVVGALARRPDTDVNVKNHAGETPLALASSHGREAVVRKLLVERNEVDVESKGYLADETPLSLAAMVGHHQIVALLLSERPDIDFECRNDAGRTPLSLAANNGHETVVRLLLSERHDINVETRDRKGWTPLSLAAENGHELVVKLLLAERPGLDVEAIDAHGRTALFRAAGNGHEAVVQRLLERDDVSADRRDNEGRTPLSFAAGEGHEGVVRLLCAQAGVDVNSHDERGRTPLAFAVRHGHEAVVGTLLERDDLDADTRDREGWTPLSWAAGEGFETIVRMLCTRKGVDLQSKDRLGRTPLSWAAVMGRVGAVRVLCAQAGVDVNVLDEARRTPLSWAAAQGYEDVVALLCERPDIEVNLEDRDGLTPLAWAARGGNVEVVRLLARRRDVDVNAKSSRGRTPLMWADVNNHEGVVRALLEEREDIDVDVTDELGMTARAHPIYREKGGV